MLILLFCFRRRESMATLLSTRWRAENFTYFTWFTKSVSLASRTFLIWVTLVRLDSGNSSRNCRKLVATFPGFHHFGKLGWIRINPLLTRLSCFWAIFGVVVVLSKFSHFPRKFVSWNRLLIDTKERQLRLYNESCNQSEATNWPST